MSQKRIQQIERRMDRIKEALGHIGVSAHENHS